MIHANPSKVWNFGRVERGVNYANHLITIIIVQTTGNKWMTNDVSTVGQITCTPSGTRDLFVTDPQPNLTPPQFFWPFEYWRHEQDIAQELTILPHGSSLWWRDFPFLMNCRVDEELGSCGSAIAGLELPDSTAEDNIDKIEARLAENDSIMDVSKATIDSLEGLMNGGGYKDSLITLIKEATDLDYLDSILHENSPLSDSVLLQAIFGPDDTTYPAQKKYDLLSDNMPLHSEHWMFLNMQDYYLGFELHVNLQDKQENGPFDSTRVAYLVHDNLIRNLESEMPMLEAELRNQYLLAEDSLGERTALENAKSFTSKMILTDRLFDERDFTACQEMLDTLPDIVEKEWLAQTEEYVDYMELLMDAFATDSTIEVDSAQRVQLESWAKDTTLFIHSRARSLMSLVFDSTYQYNILNPEEPSSKWSGSKEETEETETIEGSTEELTFKLYPNPNSGTMTLEYSLDSESGRLKLYDLAGRMLEEVLLPDKSGKIEIQATNLKGGMYLFHIESKEEELFTGRVVIIN